MLLNKLRLQQHMLTLQSCRAFTGKTESGFKFRTPKMRMKTVRPIFPPPGLGLRMPADLSTQQLLRQIGGDCEEYHDKFENPNDFFDLTTREMKDKGVPTHQRKYILRCREMLRRGVLTFEYLSRRTCLENVRKA